MNMERDFEAGESKEYQEDKMRRPVRMLEIYDSIKLHLKDLQSAMNESSSRVAVTTTKRLKELCNREDMDDNTFIMAAAPIFLMFDIKLMTRILKDGRPAIQFRLIKDNERAYLPESYQSRADKLKEYIDYRERVKALGE